jgi:hypothetical protein
MSKNRELLEKIFALSHAIQTGVAYEMEKTPEHSATTPKHLRTGVNLAMLENAALAELLVGKGVVTMEEVLKSNINKLEQEVESYEARLSKTYGVKIKLG